jgi:hypothetical protein
MFYEDGRSRLKTALNFLLRLCFKAKMKASGRSKSDVPIFSSGQDK